MGKKKTFLTRKKTIFAIAVCVALLLQLVTMSVDTLAGANKATDFKLGNSFAVRNGDGAEGGNADGGNAGGGNADGVSADNPRGGYDNITDGTTGGFDVLADSTGGIFDAYKDGTGGEIEYGPGYGAAIMELDESYAQMLDYAAANGLDSPFIGQMDNNDADALFGADGNAVSSDSVLSKSADVYTGGTKAVDVLQDEIITSFGGTTQAGNNANAAVTAQPGSNNTDKTTEAPLANSADAVNNVDADSVEPRTYAEAFPDPVFRGYVFKLLPGEIRTDDSILTYEDKLALSGRKTLNLRKMEIADLTGIEYLSGLTVLDCSLNWLKELDVSENTLLEELYCGYNQLEALNFGGLASLRILDCGNNEIDSLIFDGCDSLEWLSCGSNKLTKIDVSGLYALRNLGCGANNLNALDVAGLAFLEELYCESNGLVELTLSGNENLCTLWCRDNNLTSLNLAELYKLQILDCSGNPLTALNSTDLHSLQIFRYNY